MPNPFPNKAKPNQTKLMYLVSNAVNACTFLNPVITLEPSMFINLILIKLLKCENNKSTLLYSNLNQC